MDHSLRSARAIAWRLVACVVLLSAASHLTFGDDEKKVAHRFEEYLVIPVSVHILSATDLPEIQCALTDADIDRILGKVNGIWHAAGIHWTLDKLVHEPAAAQDEFKKQQATLGADKPTPLGNFRKLAPKESRTNDGFHVYYIHKFSVNGVYLGEATAFVQETAKLRPVEGGIDEPLPRVTAHELGHGLGLPHRQDKTNLLASGTTGTSLNEAEIQKARRIARATAGTRTVPALREAAEAATKASKHDQAARLWSILAGIPGEGAAAAAKQRDESTARHKKAGG